MVGALLALVTTWLVHFLLWQAAKPSGDKCTPENCTNKTNSILKGVQLSQLHQQSNPRIST